MPNFVFFSFNEYLQKGPYGLAEDVLREVPTQMLGYMASRSIRPNPPVPPPAYDAGAHFLLIILIATICYLGIVVV
jgi:hypothetical protein